jgi:HEAT repeats
LDYVALSDPKIRLAFWIGAISILLTIILLIEIIRIRLSLRAKKIRQNRFLQQWQPILIQTIAGEAPNLPTLEAINMTDFLMLWLRFCKTLRGEAHTNLNLLLKQLPVKQHISDMLKSKKTDERLIALYTVGYMGEKEVWDELVSILDDPEHAISVTAAHSLIRIDAEKAISQVIPMIVHRRDWPVNRVALMLKEAGAAFVEAFIVIVEQAEKDNQPYLLRLMRILDVLQLNRPLVFLRHILENSKDAELVTAALKLVRSPSDLDLVRMLVSDANWSVQAQVASILGRLGTSEDVPRLVLLISAKDWWVRYRAAKSLVQLPFVSKPQIEFIKQSIPDSFGRDILEHTLAENIKS